ncbi:MULTISPECIES: tyrosine-type recombinase/integrase [Mycobacteroides]|uniref:Site-specific integrase n=2 Tax=Mycobacteroides TaxID=670516 RepID=A0A4R5P589_9MYCO|nr:MULTISPECIES: tyrosine-type recombinase/integrase [Mycobacteroides]AMT69066.1 integrase [Mycobacteroides immunogenum]ANO02090.1 integrase [Mycobacteroides immunogenum]KIU39834.1 integrase [Mycobacteroides immunogenum]KPG10870.1 integrase [Mycobacteroides immunogenum]KPG13006.1 integrase [Mycobacteroides immunogenum]
MATIESYTVAGGKRYMVRYRAPNGKQTKKRGFGTKRAAEAFAATVEVDKMTGAYVAPSLGLITVGELGPDWLEKKTAFVSPSWAHTLEIAWRVHVKPRWGATKLSDIDPLQVETWVAELSRGKSATVVIRAHNILAGILDDAVKARRLASNPSRHIDNLPKKRGKKHVYLTADDVDALANACLTPDNQTIVYVLAFCGLRWGELIALRVRDIEFLRRRISVHRNAVWVGTKCKVGETKGKENRSVPVPEFVLTKLSEQCRGRGANDLVFPNREGTFRGVNKAPRGWFARAVARSGIDSTTTPHSLRHTCASLTVSAGGNVLVLARMLGHKDASVTLKTYSDLFDSDLDALAEQLHTKYELADKSTPARGHILGTNVPD